MGGPKLSHEYGVKYPNDPKYPGGQCYTCFGTMESTWTKADTNIDLMKRKHVHEELPNKNSS